MSSEHVYCNPDNPKEVLVWADTSDAAKTRKQCARRPRDQSGHAGSGGGRSSENPRDQLEVPLASLEGTCLKARAILFTTNSRHHDFTGASGLNNSGEVVEWGARPHF